MALIKLTKPLIRSLDISQPLWQQLENEGKKKAEGSTQGWKRMYVWSATIASHRQNHSQSLDMMPTTIGLYPIPEQDTPDDPNDLCVISVEGLSHQNSASSIAQQSKLLNGHSVANVTVGATCYSAAQHMSLAHMTYFITYEIDTYATVFSPGHRHNWDTQCSLLSVNLVNRLEFTDITWTASKRQSSWQCRSRA